jgi:tetratricopeptide (TPR) repeat protein
MKKILLILFFGFLLTQSANAGGLSPWEEANAKYQSGDFKGVLAAYENILRSGKETAALDYNLGNTHTRLGHKGWALIFYERALRLSPRDEDIVWNIGVLKNAVADRIESPEGRSIGYWIRRITDRLTINEISVILSSLLALWAALSALIFIFPVVKPLGRVLVVFVLFILLTTAVLFGFKWNDVKDPRIVILDPEVQARYGPSEKETKAFTLHEGAEAKVADEAKDWLYITLPDKNSGWVPKKSCEII